MAVQLKEEKDGTILVVHVSGKLTKADYGHFVPEFERLVQEHGKLRVLFDMTDFHGWDAVAIWEDVKFDVKHFAAIERLAMVGEKKWQSGMAAFCTPFTTATIRYFDHAGAAEAKKCERSLGNEHARARQHRKDAGRRRQRIAGDG